ncbi:MAG TPA: MFS transporter [Candidatus Binatia bacterium]|nr:MFS transporter [Candidatus Binatia bacterium]
MNTPRQLLTSIRALGKERIWLLAVLTAGHFVIHWFQQFYPVILPAIKSGLNLTNVQIGALTSAQQVVVGLGQLPFGMVADSMVRHRATILALSLVSMGAAYFLLGLPAFVWALLGSALIGFGTALWHPTAAASLSNRFPERRATALSVHGTGATLSDTITPLFVGVLLANLSWQTATQVQLLPGLLFAFLLWRALAGVFTQGDSPRRRMSAQFRDVVAVITNRAFLGLSVSTGLLSMARLVILTFLPIYLQEHLHYSSVALGIYIALLHAMGTISQPLLGLLSDRFGRKAVLLPSCLLLGLFFALLALVPPGIPLGLVIVAIGLFFYTLFNIFNAAVMDVAGSNVQAATYGLTSLITQLVVIPAPMITGYLIGELGIKFAFLLAGAFLIIAGLVLAPLQLYRGTQNS